MAERSFLSACPHDCPDTCAMLTTVRDGRVMSVRGNPIILSRAGVFASR
jgi:hypothetical protein